MTEARILAALPALSKLNSWARVPYEQTLGMYEAQSAVYAMKGRIIAAALELGMCGVRIIAVERSCKTCKGTGLFDRYYDGEYYDSETCRRCTGTGRVTLRFAETDIAGFRWHTPRPKAEFLKISPELWESCEATDWAPEQPGVALDRFRLIALLNEAERALCGDKLIRWGCDWRLSNPFRYRLNFGEQEECFVCGYAALSRYSFLRDICRPGMTWRQAVCDACESKAERWPRQWPAVLVNPRYGRARWLTEYPTWGMNVPLPPMAQTEVVREWLARRGIFEGLPVPGETAFTPSGDSVDVVTILRGSAYIRHVDYRHWLYDGSSSEARLLMVSAADLRGWRLRQLTGSTNDAI